MSKIQKLELTWVGKDEQEEIEPRILIENPELSHVYGVNKNGQMKMLNEDGSFDNMLIHGDNLLALKALEQDFAGKVKCIYIDPPYNINAAGVPYDDNIEHSTWLNLMRLRLNLMKSFLTEDGFIFIQIDDDEQAYLKVMCDEIFGRSNFVTSIAIKVSPPNGVKMAHAEKTILKEKEFILVYIKDHTKIKLVPQYIDAEFDKHYNKYIVGDLNDISNCTVVSLTQILKENRLEAKISNEKFRIWLVQNKDRIFQPVGLQKIKNIDKYNIDKIIPVDGMTGYYAYKGSQVQFVSNSIKFIDGKETFARLVCDLWNDIGFNNLFQEGGVNFKNSKKPEKLIERILNLTTQKNDLVLDSFLGSGTTCAVAHKMGRKWIGIEMGDHAFTHCKPRLDNVVNGTDLTGITKNVNWQGGGSYRFYELAPSLVIKDSHGKEIINPEYNANMLAAAMAKHEGFKYSPDKGNIYKQGFASEKSFIFTTTSHLTAEYLDEIATHFTDDEYLIINCKSFDSNIANSYKNIKIKKIPQSILGKCVFGKDNYNLNIINLPTEEGINEEE